VKPAVRFIGIGLAWLILAFAVSAPPIHALALRQGVLAAIGKPSGLPPPEKGVSALKIDQPTEQSRAAAPLDIQGQLHGQGGAWLFLEIYGQDGRLLSRKLSRLGNAVDPQGELRALIDYEIPKASETGWLRVGIQDRFRRWMAVDSVGLLLLQPAEKGRLAPSPQVGYDIGIRKPISGAQISGGELLVEGFVDPTVKLPLRVQLVSEDGRIVGQRLAGGKVQGAGEPVPYSAQVPYRVTESTPVRLLVFEEGGNLLQAARLSSLELILNP
jgi:hypothetical protein